jgi:hypothetical protein
MTKAKPSTTTGYTRTFSLIAGLTPPLTATQKWVSQSQNPDGIDSIDHIYKIQNYSEFKLDLNLTVPPNGRTMIHTYTILNSAVVSALLVDDLHS